MKFIEIEDTVGLKMIVNINTIVCVADMKDYTSVVLQVNGINKFTVKQSYSEIMRLIAGVGGEVLQGAKKP